MIKQLVAGGTEAMHVYLLDINLAFLAKGAFFSSRIPPGVNCELMWLPCELPFKGTISFSQTTKAHQIFTINEASGDLESFILLTHKIMQLLASALAVCPNPHQTAFFLFLFINF